VYSICTLPLAKLQLSREDTELQSVDIPIISLPCKKREDFGFKVKMNGAYVTSEARLLHLKRKKKCFAFFSHIRH